ncbi:DNA-directed RNA polymerase iii subunit rpc2-like protein, partial [Trifolium pratense]
SHIIIGILPIMLRSCCCVLDKRDEAELAKLGECPLDPGGYFIIKGTEKHYCICYKQHGDNKNKNYDCDGKGEAVVPLMVVMKAMGMESDQEVAQLIGRDPRYTSLLLPSFEECTKCGVSTQANALAYLDSISKCAYQATKQPMFSNMQAEEVSNHEVSNPEEGKAFTILRDVFLANVPVHGDNFRPKCIYVAVMIRRIMNAILNKDAMDDKVISSF